MRGYDIDNYINHKFNKLTLIKNLNKIDKRNSKLALFKCDCGNIKEMVFTQVLEGQVQSCGCEWGNCSSEELIKKKVSQINTFLSQKEKDTKSGYNGITKIANKYRVRICVNKKSIHLGYFDKLEDAIKARKEAEDKYFKPFLEKYKKLD